MGASFSKWVPLLVYPSHLFQIYKSATSRLVVLLKPSLSLLILGSCSGGDDPRQWVCLFVLPYVTLVTSCPSHLLQTSRWWCRVTAELTCAIWFLSFEFWSLIFDLSFLSYNSWFLIFDLPFLIFPFSFLLLFFPHSSFSSFCFPFFSLHFLYFIFHFSFSYFQSLIFHFLLSRFPLELPTSLNLGLDFVFDSSSLLILCFLISIHWLKLSALFGLILGFQLATLAVPRWPWWLL